MVGYVDENLYCGRCGLYLRRSGRAWRCISLLETEWCTSALKISTGNGPVEYGAVDLYWGSSGRVDLHWGKYGRICRCRSLLVTYW